MYLSPPSSSGTFGLTSRGVPASLRGWLVHDRWLLPLSLHFLCTSLRFCTVGKFLASFMVGAAVSGRSVEVGSSLPGLYSEGERLG